MFQSSLVSHSGVGVIRVSILFLRGPAVTEKSGKVKEYYNFLSLKKKSLNSINFEVSERSRTEFLRMHSYLKSVLTPECVRFFLFFVPIQKLTINPQLTPDNKT